MSAGNRNHILDDTVAGAVVFLVALPLCLGIALASDVPPFAGIISGVIGGMLVTAISRSRLGVSGPAAGLAVIVAASVRELGYETFLLALVIAGVIQLVGGFMRAGIISHYFPSSVIKGLLAGIGVTLILKQIPHALGYDKSWIGEMEFIQVHGHNTLSTLYYAVLSSTEGPVLVAAVSMVILIAWERPRIKNNAILRSIPAALLVVVFGVAINETFKAIYPEWTISPDHCVVLPIAKSWTELSGFFTLPDFSKQALLNPDVYVVGFTLALVASLETLICVEATDKLDPEKRVTPTNLELKAQGIGNIACGLLGGIPVTQVIVRSAANLDAGGKTRLSSFIHGVLLLVCVLLIPTWLNQIPLACLAAILLITGYKLARISLFVNMYRAGIWQFAPFVATIVVLVFTDMLTGILVGLAIGLFHILLYNYKLSHLKKDLGDGKYLIRLAEHATFLNKAAVMNALRELPDGCHVTIDATHSLMIDPDVREVIRNFAAHAPLDGTTLEVKGIDDLDAPMPESH